MIAEGYPPRADRRHERRGIHRSLPAGVTDSGLMTVTTVDHAMGAASIGEQLRPTQVTFGGNPKAGTPFSRPATAMFTGAAAGAMS